MASLVRYSGIYTSHPPNRPNQPLEARALNPRDPTHERKPETGNAGYDGYTVLSRASRRTGERFIVGSPEQEFYGPNLNED